ncbi:hypothetical protein TWF281_009022 [Arthrobotrys megalospora]
MSWFKSAAQSRRNAKSKSSLSLFGGHDKLETTMPRIQAPFRNESPSIRPRYIENVDKESFDRYRGAGSESVSDGIHVPASHENEAAVSYRTLPSATDPEFEPPLRSKLADKPRTSNSSQGSSIASTNTIAAQSISSSTTVASYESGSGSPPRKSAPADIESSKDSSTKSQKKATSAAPSPPAEDPIIRTEAALLAKDPFFYERIEFHVNNAEDAFKSSEWDVALDNIEVVYDIFKGIDIVLMMGDEDKFLLLQRLIISRCMSVLAARFYADSVLHLSKQWRNLLRREGLRDTKSQAWVDLVGILAHIQTEKYEEAQKSCHKYLRPEYIKDETNSETNNTLNAYGFWLMAEILIKREKQTEAKFYSSKIPKEIDKGIHFNWVSHCLSRSDPQLLQSQTNPKARNSSGKP